MVDLVADNKRTSAMLVGGLALFVAVVVGLVAALVGLGWIGLLIALVAAGLVAAAAYLGSARLVLSMSGARPADPRDHARLLNLVDGLCVAGGLPTPAVYVIDDAAPNAFATGRNPKNAAVVVTAGLLDQLDRVELEAVLAHELSNIRSYDTLVTTVAVPPALVPGVGRLAHRAISPRREFVADAAAVELTRYPPGMISALEKMQRTGTVVGSASRATAPLWIEDPVAHGDDVSATHPPLEERIAVLREL